VEAKNLPNGRTLTTTRPKINGNLEILTHPRNAFLATTLTDPL